MEHRVTKGLTDRTRVGVMPIGRHALWCVPNGFERLPEKALDCFHIPFLAQHAINQIPISVDGTIQITPLPMHACP